MSNFALRTARRRVDDFANQLAVIRQSREAMECRDCEDYLQLGIDAFNWLKRANDQWEEAKSDFDSENRRDISIEMADQAIRQLYFVWLRSSEEAKKRINVQVGRGYVVDNRDEFESCVEQVREIVEQRPPGLQVDATDAALEQYVGELGVDLKSMLDIAGARFSSDAIAPNCDQIDDTDITSLSHDDRSVFDG